VKKIILMLFSRKLVDSCGTIALNKCLTGKEKKERNLKSYNSAVNVIECKQIYDIVLLKP